ncbi:MAG: 2-C-methyl-D-erythritol 2,4-cyclodiphosphate synthase [Candidatus Omnitrophota bacterium]
MKYRIGIGYDIHRLVSGRRFLLGGVDIPHSKGLLGHSDADALLHAICDALLGALGKGDIGELFPDTDPRYKDASSSGLLKEVAGILRRRNFVIRNIDTVVIAEEPKLTLYKDKIRKNICGILNIKEGCVNIKAKTNEGLGEVGRKKAVACWAIAAISIRP